MTTKKSIPSCILFLSLLLAFTTSCNNEDETPVDPTDAITLNMLDEQNGKTLLGSSNVYINKANNFYTQYNFISDIGSAYGLGVKIDPKLNNLAREVAVTPGHLYQVFERSTIRVFPSGTPAVEIGAAYYKVYAIENIISNNKTCGAKVKYCSVYPKTKGLPQWEQDLGVLKNIGDQIEMILPKGAECFFETGNSSGEDGAFDISTNNGKLVITLNKSANKEIGPYGTYRTYIRLGSSFSSVIGNVLY